MKIENPIMHSQTHTAQHKKKYTASIETKDTYQFVVKSQIGNKHFYVTSKHVHITPVDSTNGTKTMHLFVTDY